MRCPAKIRRRSPCTFPADTREAIRAKQMQKKGGEKHAQKRKRDDSATPWVAQVQYGDAFVLTKSG